VCPVSVEAISWMLNLAPVPRDRGGQPSSACKFAGWDLNLGLVRDDLEEAESAGRTSPARR